MCEEVLTVTELNTRVRSRLEMDPALARVAVAGEVSGYKRYAGSGYHYFSLKDERCVVSCVITRMNARHLRVLPQDGMGVVLLGNVTLYEPQGKYQLNVTEVLPLGAGELEAAFERLRARLEAEGLFDPAKKRPLPRYPERVGVITSASGAVIHDIIRTLGKRWPAAKILLMPVAVQGESAPGQIAAAILWASRHRVADVLITGRGGGSREDLWAFNDEGVARAIAACQIPVISAVGHRPDITIADYVADFSAHTPTDAAEIAGPDTGEVLTAVHSYAGRLARAVETDLKNLSRQVRALADRPVLSDPGALFRSRRQTLDWRMESLYAAMERGNTARRGRLEALTARLDALSPLRVLARGYAVVQREGRPLRRTAEAAPGDHLQLRLSDGQIHCTVEESFPDDGTEAEL